MPNPESKEINEIVAKYITRESHKGSVNRIRHLMEVDLEALIDKRETAARIDEFQKMIKMQEDYEARLKADREKGIYPVSFGSANGAIANAGWLNYFRDRIKALSAKHSSKEDV